MTPEAAVVAWARELRDCGDEDRRSCLVVNLGRAVEELDAWLRRAWDWLDEHPGAPDHRAREDRLLERLRVYERAVAALQLARQREG